VAGPNKAVAAAGIHTVEVVVLVAGMTMTKMPLATG
jgi:hypothetical protein